MSDGRSGCCTDAPAGQGVDRLDRRLVGEVEGYGDMSCLTVLARADLKSVQRGLLYHHLDHPLNHHLGGHLLHQLDHQRTRLPPDAGVPLDRQAPEWQDEGTPLKETDRQGRGLGTQAHAPNMAQIMHESYLTLRGVDPSPLLGRNVRE